MSGDKTRDILYQPPADVRFASAPCHDKHWIKNHILNKITNLFYAPTNQIKIRTDVMQNSCNRMHSSHTRKMKYYTSACNQTLFHHRAKPVLFSMPHKVKNNFSYAQAFMVFTVGGSRWNLLCCKNTWRWSRFPVRALLAITVLGGRATHWRRWDHGRNFLHHAATSVRPVLSRNSRPPQ